MQQPIICLYSLQSQFIFQKYLVRTGASFSGHQPQRSAQAVSAAPVILFVSIQSIWNVFWFLLLPKRTILRTLCKLPAWSTFCWRDSGMYKIFCRLHSKLYICTEMITNGHNDPSSCTHSHLGDFLSIPKTQYPVILFRWEKSSTLLVRFWILLRDIKKTVMCWNKT
jgi:hypothetical protein